MSRYLAVLALCAAIFPPARASAQGVGQPRERLVLPKRFQPPAGMCRIWIDGVPPAKQPAPTDCVTALRDRPSNGQVVFGDNLPGLRPRGNGRRDE